MRAPEHPKGGRWRWRRPGVDDGRIELGPLGEAGQALRGEGLVELDCGEVRPAEPGAGERAAAASTGPMP